MNTQQQLVAYARQIAVYRGYTDLVDGLQPLDTLLAKLEHEMEELLEAQRTTSLMHVLHEAADVLYYSACLQAARPGHPEWQYGRGWLCQRGVDPQAAERAALAKYGWRAGGATRKDEAYELRLIAEAVGEIS